MVDKSDDSNNVSLGLLPPVRHEGGASISGEMCFMIGILRMAVNDLKRWTVRLQSGKCRTPAKQVRIYRELRQCWAWFNSSERYVCSFEYICEVLGLDPHYLRRRLQRMIPSIEGRCGTLTEEKSWRSRKPRTRVLMDFY